MSARELSSNKHFVNKRTKYGKIIFNHYNIIMSIIKLRKLRLNNSVL